MAPQDSPLISIVFPAYNEGAAIRAALEHALGFITANGWDAEIVVVNDGSRDDTEQQAAEIAGRDPHVSILSHTPNRGKGYAVARGMRHARGRFRIFLDVDLATPIEESLRVLPLLEHGADLVIGSRHRPGAAIEIPQPWLRRAMGSVFRWLATSALRLRVTDVTCGFKGMRGDIAEALFSVQHEHGWAFDAELIYVARKWGLRLEELPVHWRDSGDSRVRPFAAAWQALQEIRRIPRHDREGAYARPQPPPAR